MQFNKKLSLTYLALFTMLIGALAIKDKIDFGYILIAPSLPTEMRRIQEVDSITFFKPGYKSSRQSYDEYVGGFWRYIEEIDLGETGYVGSSNCDKSKCQASRVLVALHEIGVLTGDENEHWLASPELREFHNQIKNSDFIESRNISIDILKQSAGIAIEARGLQDSYIFLAYYGRSHGTANEIHGVFGNIFRYERTPYYEILLRKESQKNLLVPVKANSFFHGGSSSFSLFKLVTLGSFFLILNLLSLSIIKSLSKSQETK